MTNPSSCDLTRLVLGDHGIQPERPHAVYSLMSAYRLSDDRSLQLVSLAKHFCQEVAARTTIAADDVWRMLEEAPDLEDNLYRIDGWATLSAFVTGGALVLRMPTMPEAI